MEEKSNLYIVAIVGIVAIVALIILVIGAKERAESPPIAVEGYDTVTDATGQVMATQCPTGYVYCYRAHRCMIRWYAEMYCDYPSS